MKHNLLWIYIVFLLIGGVLGLIKGKSKISLITSVLFAGLLTLCALHWLEMAYLPEVILGLLAVVFGIRLAKTKKFMPSGMMLAVTTVVLVLRFVL